MSMDDLFTNQPIRRFAVSLSLSDLNGGKSRRRRGAPVQETPRVKSESELREETAWKQVEETGKPVVLEDCLLLPKGMSVSKAIEYLPENIREKTEEAWHTTLSRVWRLIFDQTEEEIRKKADENGSLSAYDSLPWVAKSALTESIVRQQWNLPEVPLEELIRQRQERIDETLTNPQSKKRVRANKRPVKHLPASAPSADGVIGAKAADKAVPSAIFAADTRATISEHKPDEADASDRVLEWNRNHHRFLLRRLDQIWSYLDMEEQQEVQQMLKRRIGAEEIAQIDEIVTGVSWVRRLEGK
jgi:hypothetical protein